MYLEDFANSAQHYLADAYQESGTDVGAARFIIAGLCHRVMRRERRRSHSLNRPHP